MARGSSPYGLPVPRPSVARPDARESSRAAKRMSSHRRQGLRAQRIATARRSAVIDHHLLSDRAGDRFAQIVSDQRQCEVDTGGNPAEVQIAPSRTWIWSGSTRTAGKCRRNCSARRQCVVARRPSSSRPRQHETHPNIRCTSAGPAPPVRADSRGYRHTALRSGCPPRPRPTSVSGAEALSAAMLSSVTPDELRTLPPMIDTIVSLYASGAIRPAISNAEIGPAASSNWKPS